MSDGSNQLIGYSLSFCVSDILRGEVKEAQVTRIVASICAPTSGDFDKVLESYAQCYWRDKPDEGIAIARRLYDQGKIDQPRLRGEEIMHVGNGHWKLIEPGKAPAAARQDDTHYGLYDPGALKGNAVEIWRENVTSATVSALKDGTNAPVSVRRLQLKKSP
jgi:hypothetical protein